jgi:hypothetical protein
VARVNIFFGDFWVENRGLEKVSGIPVKSFTINMISPLEARPLRLLDGLLRQLTERWLGWQPEFIPGESTPGPFRGVLTGPPAGIPGRNPQAGADQAQ